MSFCVKAFIIMSEESLVHRYECTQLFGYEGPGQTCSEEDIITAVQFDHSGQLLAVGDRSGRVIMFASKSAQDERGDYNYSFEFNSHRGGIDALTSNRISETITQINWLRPQDKYHKILTSNSNTIKLWKFFEKTKKRVVKFADGNLNIPRLQDDAQPTSVVNLAKVFPSKHVGPLNAVNVSGNQQYVLTTDHSCAFLWDLERPTSPFILSNFCEPVSKNEKSEEITCSKFHPDSENIFIFGTNKGLLGLNDLRISASNSNTLRFEYNPCEDAKFLCDIIKKYSAVSFAKGGRYLVTRDLISVKVWDVCSNKEPLQTLLVDQKIKSRLYDLFDYDCLQDSFSLTEKPHTSEILTGNYSNSFHLFNVDKRTNVQYELDFSKKTQARTVWGSLPAVNKFNCNEKILIHALNPISHQIAVPSKNCFFVYSKKAGS